MTRQSMIIHIDRSKSPIYPWMGELLHPELELCGPTIMDVSLLEKWFHPEQRTCRLKGEDIYQYLLNHALLADCCGLLDFYELQKVDVKVLRGLIGSKSVYGWKSIRRRDTSGLLYVPHMTNSIIRWSLVEDPWCGLISALRYRSVDASGETM